MDYEDELKKNIGPRLAETKMFNKGISELENKVNSENKKIKNIDIPQAIQKIYSDANDKIILNEYAVKLFKEQYGRILELYQPNILLGDKLEEHFEKMFYILTRGLERLKKLKNDEGRSVSIEESIIDDFDKKHSGILSDWVTFEHVTYTGFGMRKEFGYKLILKPEGRQILENLEQYAKLKDKDSSKSQ